MSKAARFFKFVRSVKAHKTFPYSVNYDITSKCNLECEHCYWRKTYNSTTELSDEEWAAVFREHKQKGALVAYLTGGEPTLRPAVIRSAAQVFNGIGIISNGTIRVPDDIQCRVFVSIDGPKEVHDHIRKAEVFDRVMTNIKDDKRVILTPTLSTTNYRNIDDLIAITRQANVEGITFSTYTSHAKSGDPLLLEGDALEWTVKKLLEVWKKNKDIVFLTPKVIKLFRTKEHYQHCFFRSDNFISFDANMNVKKPCTLGKGVNCKTCGCIVPVMSYALKKIDIKSFYLLDRLFPQKYLDF